MKRRDFSLACGAAVAGAGLIQSTAWAQAKPPEAGVDYQSLEKRVIVDAPSGKIEVVGFFWYNCPHCSAFEPAFDAWSKRAAKDVAVRRVPIAFRDDFAPQQRLFYALEAMGLVDKLHVKVFTAIHTEKKDLSKVDAIVEWIARQGVDKAKFLEQYNSFSVATKASRATQLQNAYKIDGVPAIGVAGRYWTDGVMAKGMDRALQVVEFLLANIRAGK
ncbi:MAG: thiol:disulfide interchange protein DsbA/DsbL [Rhodoferax sp.]